MTTLEQRGPQRFSRLEISFVEYAELDALHSVVGQAQAGELEVDLDSRLLRKNGQEIHLSPKEFELLALLMRHPGVPFTHSRLLRGVWGAEYGGELEYLRTYVKFLRKKIEADPATPAYILTEPWVGYRFRDPADADSTSARLAENGT